jgi:hypothetical protein
MEGTMDNAIWAIWYDLPDQDNTDYFNWMHNDYLPSIQQKPGCLWAAHYKAGGKEGDGMKNIRDNLPSADDKDIGHGTQYLQLIGSAEVATLTGGNTFINDKDTVSHKMLNRRIGSRACLFQVISRVDGPETIKRIPATTPGPVIQMGSFRTKTIADEFDVCSWYTQHRLPAIARLPGCIAARTMLCAAGWAKFSVMYEFTSLEDRQKNFEEKHEALGLTDDKWTHRIHNYTIHAPGSPTVAERIWPSVK